MEGDGNQGPESVYFWCLFAHSKKTRINHNPCSTREYTDLLPQIVLNGLTFQARFSTQAFPQISVIVRKLELLILLFYYRLADRPLR